MFAWKGGLLMREKAEDHQQLMRAQYPDDTQPTIYRTLDDKADYPDIVYQMQNRQQTQAAASNGMGSWAVGGTGRKQRHTAFWSFLALICFCLLCLMGYFMISLYQDYRPFRQKAAIVGQSSFAQGVLVDGVHIGGMSRAQAEEALKNQAQQSGGNLWLTVRVDDQTWVITPNDLPLERNISSVLDTAYAVGRQGTRETIASSVTPFEYRYAHLYHTVTTPVNFYTSVTYDPDRLWKLVRSIENTVNRAAEDAQVATFDFSTRSFTFTEDRQGARLDAEALYRQIADALDRKDYHGMVQAYAEPIMPKVTRVELMNSFALVSSYTTTTTSDANRNNNINLAANAVSGTVVMPG